MDVENHNCSRAEGYMKRSQAQTKGHLMARICVAERERAAGMSRDAFEALAELELKLRLV